MKLQRHLTHAPGFRMLAEAGDPLPIREAGEVWAPREWPIEWHTNPGWELYLQLKGSAAWDIGGCRERTVEGGAYLIREGVRHRLRFFESDPVHFIYLIFPDATIPDGLRPAPCWSRDYSVYPDAGVLMTAVQGIIRELVMEEPWQHPLLTGYLQAAQAGLCRLSEEPGPRREQPLHRTAVRALDLMRARIGYAWRLDELARLAGASRPHLIALFRAAFGLTPMRKLLLLRLEEAKRQLQETDKTITDIALELGFASSQHFARCFRAEFGLSASQWRRTRERSGEVGIPDNPR
jgi:AraC-like DNA-binding protein/mannose-6-phosphate isomerase-like protein (cupin superfamily)